jgi:hypothetical protein
LLLIGNVRHMCTIPPISNSVPKKDRGIDIAVLTDHVVSFENVLFNGLAHFLKMQNLGAHHLLTLTLLRTVPSTTELERRFPLF